MTKKFSLKKIAYKKEPRLNHFHKYVVTVNKTVKFKGKNVVHTKYFYCMNRKEVRARAEAAQKGTWINVFKADHNFVQGFDRV